MHFSTDTLVEMLDFFSQKHKIIKKKKNKTRHGHKICRLQIFTFAISPFCYCFCVVLFFAQRERKFLLLFGGLLLYFSSSQNVFLSVCGAQTCETVKRTTKCAIKNAVTHARHYEFGSNYLQDTFHRLVKCNFIEKTTSRTTTAATADMTYK